MKKKNNLQDEGIDLILEVEEDRKLSLPKTPEMSDMVTPDLRFDIHREEPDTTNIEINAMLKSEEVYEIQTMPNKKEVTRVNRDYTITLPEVPNFDKRETGSVRVDHPLEIPTLPDYQVAATSNPSVQSLYLHNGEAVKKTYNSYTVNKDGVGEVIRPLQNSEMFTVNVSVGNVPVVDADSKAIKHQFPTPFRSPTEAYSEMNAALELQNVITDIPKTEEGTVSHYNIKDSSLDLSSEIKTVEQINEKRRIDAVNKLKEASFIDLEESVKIQNNLIPKSNQEKLIESENKEKLISSISNSETEDTDKNVPNIKTIESSGKTSKTNRRINKKPKSPKKLKESK